MFGIDDVEAKDGIDLHGHVIARYDVLRRYLDDLDAQVDADQLRTGEPAAARCG